METQLLTQTCCFCLTDQISEMNIKRILKQLLESETQCSKINNDLRQIPFIYGKYF